MLKRSRPSWISEDLFRYIASLLASPVYSPSLALSSAMDMVFKDENWAEYEYDTILQMLDSYGLPIPSVHVLGQIQCISALKRGKSFIDKEWNLFEKAALAVTGVPVLFYDKQNVPIEYIYHALKIMTRLAKVELSEEVTHYIGCEAINDDILWYPVDVIDGAIKESLERLKDDIGIPHDEIRALRDAVKSRFNDTINKDLDKIDFSDTSAADMMCARIYRSILIGKQLTEIETSALSVLIGIKDGHIAYDGRSLSEVVSAAEVDTPEDAYDPEIELVEDQLDLESFSDGVKEAMMEYISEAEVVIKAAGFRNVPIETGATMSGQEDDKDGPSYDLETNPPDADGTSDDLAQISRQKVTNPAHAGTSPTHEIVDPSIAFEL